MSTEFGVTVAALFALTGLVPNASADETDETSGKLEELRELGPEARKEALAGMSEEERAALRESMQTRRDEQRARRESMTPEERDVARQERKKRFESMTPEQQEAMKERRAGRQQSGDRSSRRSQGRHRNRDGGNE